MSAESNSEKSVSYQKKEGRGNVCPSFFWYDNDKDLKVCFLVTRVKYVTDINRKFIHSASSTLSWRIDRMETEFYLKFLAMALQFS